VEETGEGPEPHEEQPKIPAHRDEIPDDDIGNRISGGAVDVTRETIGGRSFGRGAAPAHAATAVDGDDADDSEDEQPQPAEPAPAAKPRRARKTAAKKTAAKRPAAARRKKT
jgi:hypothetical protein